MKMLEQVHEDYGVGYNIPSPGGHWVGEDQALLNCIFRLEKIAFKLSLNKAFRLSVDLKLGLSRTKQVVSVFAVTVAVRREFETSTLSPKKSPAFRMATFFSQKNHFLTDTSTKPS